MKNIVTVEQIKKIQEARESVLGTENFGIYNCEIHYKRDNGTWSFVGWGIPSAYYGEGYLKTIKGRIWLYVNENNDLHRYALSEACIELLGLTK